MGEPTLTINVDGISQYDDITLDGRGGNDIFTVTPNPSLPYNVNIVNTGAPLTDEVQIDATALPAGSILATDGTVDLHYTITAGINLSQIDDQITLVENPAVLQIYAPDGGESINSNRSGGETELFGGAGNDTFNVQGSSSYVLDGWNGSDTYIINWGLAYTPVLINDSGNFGSDSLVIDDSANEALLQATYDVSSSSVTRVDNEGGFLSTASINFYHMSAVTVDTGADSVARLPNIVNVESTAAATATAITSGTGHDDVQITDSAKTLDPIQGRLTVNGNGLDAVTINDQQDTSLLNQYSLSGTSLTRIGIVPLLGVLSSVPITFSGLASLDLYTGAYHNQVDVEGTTGPTTVHAGAGTWQIAVSAQAENLDNVAGPLTIIGNGTVPLIVNDQNNPNTIPTSDTVSGTTLTRIASGLGPRNASITYGGLASLELDTGNLLNLIHVESTTVPTTVRAGTGNLLIDVSGQAGNLDNLAGPLTVVGNGSEPLIVNDQHNPNVIPTSDTVTGTTLTRIASGPGGALDSRDASITYGGLASLELDTGNLLNLVDVEGTTVPTTVNAGTGTLQIAVSAQAENLDNVAGPLTVNGNGSDPLIVNDQRNPNTIPTSDTVSGTTLTRTASGPRGGIDPRDASIAYGGLASLELDTGNLLNLVDVEGTTVPTTVNAGTGNLRIDVSGQAENLDNLAGALTVNGNGSDGLVIDDQATPTGQSYAVAANKITRTAFATPQASPTATINYSNLANVSVNGGGTGVSNLFYVTSTAAGTLTSLAGIGSTEFVAADALPSLNSIQGPLALHGLGQNNYMVLNDYDSPASQTYTLTSNKVQRSGMADITFDGMVQNIVYTGNKFANTVNVLGVAANVFTPIVLAPAALLRLAIRSKGAARWRTFWALCDRSPRAATPQRSSSTTRATASPTK